MKTHYATGNDIMTPICGFNPFDKEVAEWTTTMDKKQVTCTNCKRTKAYKEACSRVSGKATETLRTYNAWRRGNDESIQATDPTELGIAIDTVLESHAEMLDLLCDCAGQFLISHDDGTLSHSYMSTEERLCAYLVAAGRMEVVSRGRFRFVEVAAERILEMCKISQKTST